MPEEETSSNPQPDVRERLEAFNRVYDRLKDLAQASDLTTDASVQLTTEGGVTGPQIVELLNSQPGIDIRDTKEGDAVWWKTKSGDAGYYLKDSTGGGSMRLITQDGKQEDLPYTQVDGASFGGWAKSGFILENMPVAFRSWRLKPADASTDWYQLTDDEVWGKTPVRRFTNVVEKAGIIRKEDYSAPKQTQ